MPRTNVLAACISHGRSGRACTASGIRVWDRWFSRRDAMERGLTARGRRRVSCGLRPNRRPCFRVLRLSVGHGRFGSRGSARLAPRPWLDVGHVRSPRRTVRVRAPRLSPWLGDDDDRTHVMAFEPADRSTFFSVDIRFSASRRPPRRADGMNASPCSAVAKTGWSTDRAPLHFDRHPDAACGMGTAEPDQSTAHSQPCPT